MEEALMQSQITMDKSNSVILDIESLTQPSDKCSSGSPKMTKVLSRKGSCRLERRSCEDQKADEVSKKHGFKGVLSSQLEQLKLPLVQQNKALGAAQSAANSPIPAESSDGWNKRSCNRLPVIHPQKILLLFATVSSMGTMILIYFTLAINRRGGS